MRWFAVSEIQRRGLPSRRSGAVRRHEAVGRVVAVGQGRRGGGDTARRRRDGLAREEGPRAGAGAVVPELRRPAPVPFGGPLQPVQPVVDVPAGVLHPRPAARARGVAGHDPPGARRRPGAPDQLGLLHLRQVVVAVKGKKWSGAARPTLVYRKSSSFWNQLV